MMTRFMMAAGAATAVVAAAMVPAWSAERTWHFDTSAIDRNANPGDSFFLYANGNWDRNTPIPPDKPALSSFSVLQDQVNEQVKTAKKITVTGLHLTLLSPQGNLGIGADVRVAEATALIY